MDDVLSSALQRIAILEAELDVLRDFVQSYRHAISQPNSSTQKHDFKQLISLGQGTKRERSEFWKMVISEAKQIILQFGRPMNRGELVKIIQSKGFSLPGKDRTKVFGTNLWRSGEFIHIEGQGYWPREHSLEAQSNLDV